MSGANSIYKPLRDVGIEEPFLPGNEEEDRRRPLSQWMVILITIILTTTVICSLQAAYLTFRSQPTCISSASQKGFQTEWDLLTGTIENELVTYTSAFRYNSTDQSYYREFNPADPQYVGTPSPEIDKAWDELLYGERQYLVVTEEEAQHLDDPVPINGYYLAEPEVMHSLHCVNAIRKALKHDYYMTHDKHKLPEQLRQVHVEHCLDQLRQNIQCAGDLTPVPLRPYGEEPNVNLIGTPQIHTCRNWNTFRQFYTQRGDEFGMLNSGGT
ncbi:hypothetical protein EG329_010018 [Mollisiaceae sp. DMI_Dod_QoI]|nr:hypothetical protein EG329_010018 [Helotiales sp. DMI_Dod_QoI]